MYLWLFEKVGLSKNTTETQAIICIPGKIRTQLEGDLYFRRYSGLHSTEDLAVQVVECDLC